MCIVVIILQRLGRILRPKPNPTGEFNAFFYSLVSTDTKEMYFSSKRQQYLVDQGYTFKIVQDLAARADRETQVLGTKDKEADILQCILSMSTKVGAFDVEEDRALAVSSRGEYEYDSDDEGRERPGARRVAGALHGTAKRKVTDLNALSGGGDGLLYAEFKSGK